MMKRHTKRLFMAGLTVLAASLVTGSIFYPLFAVDSGSLSGASSYLGEDAPGAMRDVYGKVAPSSFGETENVPLSSDFELVLDNGQTQLYCRKDTGEIALKRADAENIWYSNPQDREGETMFGGKKKAALASQFSLTYINDNLTRSMDSYNDCAVNGGLEYGMEDGVFTVTYHIGDEKLSAEDFPQQIEASRWEAFLEKASDETRKELKKLYVVLRREELSDRMYERMTEKYPRLAECDLYYLKTTTGSDQFFRKFQSYLDEIGYTREDMAYDNEWAGIETEKEVQPHFDIVLEYRLEGETLSVLLDTAKMVYEPEIPVLQIDLLPYFGAGGLQDEGFLFVPDGSGSLVYFNNGKKDAGRLELGIYGEENAVSPTSNYQISEGVSLPVYGIQKGREALLAEVAQGASKMRLIAAVSGIDSSYNTIYPRCEHILSSLVRVTSEVTASAMTMVDRHPYEGAYEVRFTPLKEEESGYVGMARFYRNQLLERNLLPRAEVSDVLPLVVSALGGTTTERTILGVTVPSVEVMTGYVEAGEMVRQLMEEGAEGVILRYLGWFNGGVDQSYAGRVSYIQEMGGKKKFGDLAETLSKAGIPFYPEVSFLNIDRTGKGFSKNKMNIRGVSRDILVSYHYNAVDHYRITSRNPVYHLKPSVLQGEVESFLKNYPFKTGISTADLGSLLYADYDDDTPTDRETAADLVGRSLERLGETIPLMLTFPHLYAIKEADILVNVPCGDSMLEMEDAAVPFYQIVVRGSVDYVSKPLDYEPDYKMALLKAVEYGAGFNYLFMDKQPALLKESDFNQFYTGAFTEWKETVLRDYEAAAEAMNGLQGLEIVDHRQLEAQLYCTWYEDGTKVLVNYSDTEKVADGVMVDGKGYRVVKE